MPKPRDYYVLLDSMHNLTGAPIWKDKDDKRRISLTPRQAQYWLDQGALSLNPPTDAVKKAAAQMAGAPVEAPKK